MEIKNIFNSNAQLKKFATGWGLSWLINKNILFDTGESGKYLLRNIEKLDIDISMITKVVISHEHWDHINGLWELLQKKKNLKVYACPSFSLEFKRRVDELQGRLFEIDKFVNIQENIFLTGEIAGTYKGDYMPEQALVIKSPKGLSIITGCAHPGIVNIIEKVLAAFPKENIYAVFGGFHLMNTEAKRIEKIAEKFKEMKIKVVCPTHCSGKDAERIFKNLYNENFLACDVGTVVDV